MSNDQIWLRKIREKSSDKICILNHNENSPKSGMPMCQKCCWKNGNFYVFVGFESGEIRVWRVEISTECFMTSMNQQILKLSNEPILSLDVSHSGINLWNDINSLNCIFISIVLTIISGETIRGFAVSVSDNLFSFELSENFSVKNLFTENNGTFWQKHQKSKILPFRGSSSVCLRQDGKLLTIGQWNGEIYVFSAKTGKPLAMIAAKQHTETITCCLFCDLETTPRYLACGSKDGLVSLWLLYDWIKNWEIWCYDYCCNDLRNYY